MANTRRKVKGRKDSHRSFAGVPRIVMDHPDYINLPLKAKELLWWFAYQYKGTNNGDLTAAYSWLKKRGFKCKQSISRAVSQLIEARLIVRTREGRFLNPGGQCALYAVTWAGIGECKGKELDLNFTPSKKPLRQFSLERIENPCPSSGLGSGRIQGRQIARDGSGKFISPLKRGRLTVVT